MKGWATIYCYSELVYYTCLVSALNKKALSSRYPNQMQGTQVHIFGCERDEFGHFDFGASRSPLRQTRAAFFADVQLLYVKNCWNNWNIGNDLKWSLIFTMVNLVKMYFLLFLFVLILCLYVTSYRLYTEYAMCQDGDEVIQQYDG